MIEILVKLAPIYIIIIIGIIANRFLSLDKKSLAELNIYILSPIVTFYAIIKSDLALSSLSILIIMYLTTTIIYFLSFYLIGIFRKKANKSIMSYAIACGNTGYFGIPVALALIGKDSTSLIIILSFGIVLFENSIGLFLLFEEISFKDSLKKILKIPTTYAFVMGLLLKENFNITADLKGIFDLLTHVYIFLGIIIIGLNINRCKLSDINFIDFFTVIILKPVIWVSITLFYIYLDRSYFHLYSALHYKVLLIISIVPVGANLVSWCTILSTNGKNSTAYLVLASTCLSIFYASYILRIF